MNKEQQIEFFRKLCSKMGVADDLIDFHSLVAEDINFEENKTIVIPIIEGLASSQNLAKKIDVEGTRNAIKLEKDLQANIEIEQLKRETENTEKEFEQSLNSIKFTTTSELDKYYRIMGKLIQTLVKSDKINGSIIRGGSGLGKSFNTIKVLSDLGLKKGENFEILSSYVTPLEFYSFLYNNREGKILILDDLMSLLNNQINIGILLSALWGEGKRIVHYHSSSKKLEVPQSFLFNSKIIWCVNDLPKNLEALKSRCFYYSLEFSFADKMRLFYEIAKVQGIPFEVVEFIHEHTNEGTENLDFRLLWKVYEIQKANPHDWREIAGVGLNKDEKIVLLKQLLKECSSVKEAEQKFMSQENCCRKTFYNYKAKLEVKR